MEQKKTIQVDTKVMLRLWVAAAASRYYAGDTRARAEESQTGEGSILYLYAASKIQHQAFRATRGAIYLDSEDLL